MEEDAATDVLIQEALACPCVKDLRESPCGPSFESAFTCFHKSKATPKGDDCAQHNTEFLNCLRSHPAAAAAATAAKTEETGKTAAASS
ncbi:hypothetical protein DUNSADRAFT_1261 [Dunaliella salina]|uniref:CHCH domain-containing protein n=1 Tax=Dunaliella salina TaxID=3046 RepID=A0ABQ7GX88_DUNSA|nr:hypothetical protein DUNSADRAFT_1261 [Dunaliella salina]|eukprot:KAF5839227.1 hypothetical protein DUNSADRAFT_1261 [Dunaliella salina]